MSELILSGRAAMTEQTPAARQFAAWLIAFNAGERSALVAYHQQHFPYDVANAVLNDIERELALSQFTRGLDVQKFETETSTSIVVLLKERRTSKVFLRAAMEIDAAEPHRVVRFEMDAIPMPDEFLSAEERASREADDAKRRAFFAAATPEDAVSVEVKLPRVVVELLAVLDLDVAHQPRTAHEFGKPGKAIPSFATLAQRCARVLMQLADHAQQGVHRNGGWERQWIIDAFGDGWLERTEPGDPYDRIDDKVDVELSQRLYRRPKRG